jgi:hypothetical protein
MVQVGQSFGTQSESPHVYGTREERAIGAARDLWVIRIKPCYVDSKVMHDWKWSRSGDGKLLNIGPGMVEER